MSFVKNQILKHLSKFAKNLSPDKIHLNTVKGYGDLENLELNEDMLTELLDLPVWLKITKASCDKLSVQIEWTRLQKVPIQLRLEEVVVEMETCENFRDPSPKSVAPSYTAGGKYGYSDKVVDGISLSINTLVLNLKANDFKATMQVSVINIVSCLPTWRAAPSLKVTRVKDPATDQILLFKKATWQTLRINVDVYRPNTCEAYSETNSSLRPLKLIANQAEARLTIKKSLSDCSIIGSRSELHFDYLLWVLTDAQLTLAARMHASLASLINRANEFTKEKRTERLQRQEMEKGPQQQPRPPPPHTATRQPRVSAVDAFAVHDVHEGSAHLSLKRLDLHFCSETSADLETPLRLPPHLVDASIQLAMEGLTVNHYPYHRYNGSRANWLHYKETASLHDWLAAVGRNYEEEMLAQLPEQHHTAFRHLIGSEQCLLTPGGLTTGTQPGLNTFGVANYLLESCTYLAVDSVVVKQITLPELRSSSTHTGNSVLSGTANIPLIFMQFSDYYYLDPTTTLQPPKSTFFCSLSGLQAYFHLQTLLYANYLTELAQLLWRRVAEASLLLAEDTAPDKEKEVLTHMEVYRLRVEYPLQQTGSESANYPMMLLFELPRATLSNLFSDPACRALVRSFTGEDQFTQHEHTAPLVNSVWNELLHSSHTVYNGVSDVNGQSEEHTTLRMKLFRVDIIGFQLFTIHNFANTLDSYSSLAVSCPEVSGFSYKDESSSAAGAGRTLLLLQLQDHVELFFDHFQFLAIQRASDSLDVFTEACDALTAGVERPSAEMSLTLKLPGLVLNCLGPTDTMTAPKFCDADTQVDELDLSPLLSLVVDDDTGYVSEFVTEGPSYSHSQVEFSFSEEVVQRHNLSVGDTLPLDLHNRIQSASVPVTLNGSPRASRHVAAVLDDTQSMGSTTSSGGTPQDYGFALEGGIRQLLPNCTSAASDMSAMRPRDLALLCGKREILLCPFVLGCTHVVFFTEHKDTVLSTFSSGLTTPAPKIVQLSQLKATTDGEELPELPWREPAAIRLTFCTGPQFQAITKTKAKGAIQLQVEGWQNSSFHASTLDTLIQLVHDPSPPPPVPIHISLADVSLSLIEDQRNRWGETSAELPAQVFKVDFLEIVRDSNNKFKIRRDSRVDGLSQRVSDLERENEQLRAQLRNLDIQL